MKKGKIVLLCVLGALVIGCVVFYIINPELAKSCLDYLLDIVNRPLPIVGITVGTILIFVWRLVITTNYGKKRIQGYDNKLHEIEQAKNDLIKEKDKAIVELKNKNDELKGFICNICELSTNQKIKNYGKELLNYGKKEIECETKAD